MIKFNQEQFLLETFRDNDEVILKARDLQNYIVKCNEKDRTISRLKGI